MSTAQLSQGLHQIQAQSVLDHQWMKVVEDAVTQHAECIDEIRRNANFLKADAVRIAATIQNVADSVENNDTDLKTVIEVNDNNLKAIIDGNDSAFKSTLEGNDAGMKKTIEKEIDLLKKVIDKQAGVTDEKFGDAFKAFKGDISRMDKAISEMRIAAAPTSTAGADAIAALYTQMETTTTLIREAQLKMDGIAANVESRLYNLESTNGADPWQPRTATPAASFGATAQGPQRQTQQQQQAHSWDHPQQSAPSPTTQQSPNWGQRAQSGHLRTTGSDGKRLFDDRVAQDQNNQYLDKGPQTWMKVTKN